MAGGHLSAVMSYLHRVAAPSSGADASDGQLLRRFADQRDEAAFAALVQRHGPMVLGVCRRVLRNTHEAEDAFQATFLVLVRKKNAIARPELLGNWLFGVAYRTALEARRRQLRRRAHETEVANMPEAIANPDRAAPDLRPLLDEEVRRLPEKYRAPVVLCYLQGKTTEEAAGLLGCPKGTVFSRLAWARERLRNRLTRRGLAVPAGVFATLLARDTAAATVPAAVVAVTVRAARALAAGTTTGLVSAKVIALTEGVMRAMLFAKLKSVAATLVAVSVVTLGIGVLALAAERNLGAELATSEAANQAAPAALEEREDAGKITVKTVPPVVVRTVPQAGDGEVDATALKEIRVTFSKSMLNESWSWSQISDETYPKTTGKPHYDKERRTCVLPVQLEPGKTYVLWLNSEKFGNFKDADGRSAVPYLLVFQTKP
jgi:RNA polymerase sigma factor (sigma-70 family)